jgi:hypothetical protein
LGRGGAPGGAPPFAVLRLKGLAASKECS